MHIRTVNFDEQQQVDEEVVLMCASAVCGRVKTIWCVIVVNNEAGAL